MREFEKKIKISRALRPTSLSDFIGQQEIVNHLGVFVKAAKKRGDSLDHLLFYGPPGLGKTTLSKIIAHELEVEIVITTAPALEKTGDLAAILTGLSPNSVLFIDEIHRLRAAVEETLYSAMEDFAIDIVIGQGAGAKTVRLPLKNFTLVGATTRTGLLSGPFFSRFGIVQRLDYYQSEDLKKIIFRNGELMGMDISESGAQELAGRVRGTPRICNNLMRRIRDYAEVDNVAVVDDKFINETLKNLGIDENGLDEMDRRYLQILVETFGGGPVGVETLSVSIGEEKETISDVYEPFLIQKGFVKRTARGRMAMDAAWDLVGLPRPKNGGELF